VRKALKITAIALAAVVGLFILAAVILTLSFDPNRYKPEIAKAVRDATGRELTLTGDISLSFFPWIGADIGEVSLANAPGFGGEPFARVQAAGVKVKLLPLLRGDIVVDRIQLDGLRLNLAKDRAGRSNWADLGGKPAAPDKPAAPAAPGTGIGAFAVGGIAVRDGQLSWHDRQAGTRYVVHNLEITSGALAGGEPVDLRVGFELESGSPPLRTPVSLDTRLAFDLEAQTLSVPRLTLAALGMTARLTDLSGTKIIDAPSFAGKLEVAPFDAKAALARLGTKVETADGAALTRVGVNTAFTASTQNVELKDFALSLDGTRIAGSLAIRNLDKPAYRFDLAAGELDLDRYMPPAPAERKAAQGGAAQAAPQPVVIPFTLLRDLDVDGKLRIEKLKASGLRSTDVATRLRAQGGVIELKPSTAKLYGGSYQGAIGIDARGKDLALSLDENLKGVSIGPMLKDMEVFENYTGTGDVAIKVTARGLDAKQIVRTLNGSAAFALRNGTIEGADIIGQAERLEEMFRAARGKEPRSKPRKTEQTAFEVLSATAPIQNGVARTSDLLLRTPNWQAQGQGSADLVNEALDLRLKVVKNADAGKPCAYYPLKLKGPFSDIGYSLDIEDRLKCEGRQAVEEKKGQVKEELKEKLREKGFDLDLLRGR